MIHRYTVTKKHLLYNNKYISCIARQEFRHTSFVHPLIMYMSKYLWRGRVLCWNITKHQCSVLLPTTGTATSFCCRNTRFTLSYWGNGKTLNPLKRKDKLRLTLLDTRGNKSSAGEPTTKTATPLDTEPQVLEEDGNLLTWWQEHSL